jgi:NadR type nicotinamide-nucleotide adenylyltransferase
LDRQIKNIFITGPESTGKTELCQKLASHFQTVWIPEYARNYVENLNCPYTFNDVEHIARQQFAEIQKDYSAEAQKYVFFDTDLIITKVWFEVVFGKFPVGFEKMISDSRFDLFLLCFPDLEWKPDKVRENGGSKRIELFEKYQNELISGNFNFKIVKGFGELRFENALKIINYFWK